MALESVLVVVLCGTDMGNFQTPLIISKTHPSPVYRIPGGDVELGESREQAAVREVSEETGIEISSTDLHWITTAVKKNRGSTHHQHTYLAVLPNTDGFRGNEEFKDGEEILVAELHGIEAIYEHIVGGKKLNNQEMLNHHKLAMKCTMDWCNQPTS